MEKGNKLTEQEYKKFHEIYGEYIGALSAYAIKCFEGEENLSSKTLTLNDYKNQVNKYAIECENELPKSLVDKLGIKKI